MGEAARAGSWRNTRRHSGQLQLEDYWKEADDNLSADSSRRNGRSGKSLMGWIAGVASERDRAAEVERLAERLRGLPVRAVYTSPLERAVETAWRSRGRTISGGTGGGSR